MFSSGQRYFEVFEISCPREQYNTGRREGNHITLIPTVGCSERTSMEGSSTEADAKMT